MKILDFKDRLHFNEFPPVTTKEWESIIASDLKGKNYKEKLRWNPGEGLAPLPFYRKDHLRELIHTPVPLHKSGKWNIVEPVEQFDPKSANAHALHALENGASALFLKLPAKSITSKADLSQLLENVQLELISIRFVCELSTPQVTGWLKEICADRGLNAKSLNITFSFDPFANALQTGKLAGKTNIKKMIRDFGRAFKSCGIYASVYGNSGATIVQQLAFALASGNEYLGLDADFATQMHFNFTSGPNYFLEIAKIRAFKLTWDQVLEAYAMKTAEPAVSAETASWNKSQADAHNNLIRATTEAMSAALSGCNSITVHRYDQHFAEDSSFASRIARNIQLILQEEAYLDKVADPGAGSYYIEMLTDQIAEESWKLFQEIESKGGFHECIKTGFIQDLISKSRDEKIEAYKEKEKVLVGVNKYMPGEVQDSKFKVQEMPAIDFEDESLIEVGKVEPLNIEAELQKGAAQ